MDNVENTNVSNTFQLWVEGYTHCNGAIEKAKLLGTIKGETFNKAVKTYAIDYGVRRGEDYKSVWFFDEKTQSWSYISSNIFDNETDARKKEIELLTEYEKCGYDPNGS